MASVSLRLLGTPENWVICCQWNRSGNMLAAGYGDGTVRLWTTDGDLEHELEAHEADVSCCAWNDDSLLATACCAKDDEVRRTTSDYVVKLWMPDGSLFCTLEGHRNWVRSCAWSKGQRSMLASGSEDGTIKLWLPNGSLAHTLQDRAPLKDVLCCTWYGDLLASGYGDGTVRLWRNDGNFVRKLDGHRGWVRCCAWNTDGSLLATGCDGDNLVRLWTRDGQEHTLRGHEQRVRCCAWNSDSSMLATGSDDNTVRLWTPDDGGLKRTLRGHNFRVWCCAWNSDSSLLASGSLDNTVRVWTPEGNLAHTLEGHKGWVWCCAWNSDSSVLATGSFDKTVRLWPHQRTVRRVISYDVHEGTIPLAERGDNDVGDVTNVESLAVRHATCPSVGYIYDYLMVGDNMDNHSTEEIVGELQDKYENYIATDELKRCPLSMKEIVSDSVFKRENAVRRRHWEKIVTAKLYRSTFPFPHPMTTDDRIQGRCTTFYDFAKLTDYMRLCKRAGHVERWPMDNTPMSADQIRFIHKVGTDYYGRDDDFMECFAVRPAPPVARAIIVNKCKRVIVTEEDIRQADAIRDGSQDFFLPLKILLSNAPAGLFLDECYFDLGMMDYDEQDHWIIETGSDSPDELIKAWKQYWAKDIFSFQNITTGESMGAVELNGGNVVMNENTAQITVGINL